MRHSWKSTEKFILSREFFGMKLGLENITEFLEQIGTPQNDYPTVHIAGTNGKGSTAVMLASVFQQAGYKTGLFTSPHLVTLRERVRVDGKMIPKQSVVGFINRHRKELTRRKISYFELVSAMAFDHFSRQRVDIAVIETGLGGRLDATNVLRPEITLTTDIGYDHMEILGATLPKIAGEKAGIIKAGVPHVIGRMAPSAEKVIRSRCRELKTRMYKLTARDFKSADQKSLKFNSCGLKVDRVAPGLKGDHQIKNAALALKTVAILKKNGWKLSKKAIAIGMGAAAFSGRFQELKLRNKPLHILDVCHNAPGVEAMVLSLETHYPNRKIRVLTGFVRLKQHQQMLDSLKRVAEFVAIVPLKTGRSVDVKELISQLDFGSLEHKAFGSQKSAYRHLLKSSDPDDIIVVAGSHYLVGEFLEKHGS